MYKLFALYKHKSSYTAASDVSLRVGYTVMIDQPLPVRIVKESPPFVQQVIKKE